MDYITGYSFLNSEFLAFCGIVAGFISLTLYFSITAFLRGARDYNYLKLYKSLFPEKDKGKELALQVRRKLFKQGKI